MSISVTLYFREHLSACVYVCVYEKGFFSPFSFIVVYRGWRDENGKKWFLEILESIVCRENILDFPFLIF